MVIDVAPLAGAWIEISKGIVDEVRSESLPSRERGLKFYPAVPDGFDYFVAPLAGAWIEISLVLTKPQILLVAPLAGAWIEI